MNSELLEKSINARNQEAFFKLANIESNREWSMNKQVPPTPKVNLKVEKIPFSAGMFNLLKELRP